MAFQRCSQAQNQSRALPVRELITPNPKLRLMDQVREVMRLKHYSIRTERSYCDWIKRYIRFGALRLRVKDLDFEMHQLTVRDGKGFKDRYTVLADGVIPALREHLEYVRACHQEDLRAGYGAVYLPGALDRKHRGAAREWGWQYVFPARGLSRDPRSGIIRRHHVDEVVLFGRGYRPDTRQGEPPGGRPQRPMARTT
jgi:hypothetical protein